MQLFSLFVVGTSLLLAGGNPGKPNPVAIKDATIIVSPEQTIEKGTIVLRGGLIEAVGPSTEVAIPYDAEVIDGAGLFVYPGFIDAYTNLGMPKVIRTQEEEDAAESEQPDPSDGPPVATREANRKGTFPEFNAADHIVVGESDIKNHHKAGFTAALCAPPSELLGGHSAFIHLSGRPRREAVTSPSVFMHAGFSTAGEGYPETLMGFVAHQRQIVADARRFGELIHLHHQNLPGVRRPPVDMSLMSFQQVLDHDTDLAIEAGDVNSIRQALSLAREIGLSRVWIVGGAEAYKCVDELKEAQAIVLLSLDWPDEPEKERKKQIDLPVAKRQLQEEDRLWKECVECAVALDKTGVRFAFSSKGTVPNKTLDHVRELIERGLPESSALAALTLVPEELCDACSSGMLVTGRSSNVVVWTGKFSDKKSKVRYVFADGIKFEYEAEEKKKPTKDPEVDVTGTWTITTTFRGQSRESTLILEQKGSDVTGKMVSERGDREIEEGMVSGKTLSFKITFEGGGRSFSTEYSGEVEGDEITGTMESAMGEVDFTGVKKPGDGGNE